MPTLSLIIATYNRAAQLVTALESLAVQTAQAESWECIVVDNNSADDTAQRFAEFVSSRQLSNFRIVAESRQGLSHARNRGIAESRGVYIAIIDDDEYVNEGFVEAYISFFDSHPGYSAAGGRVIAQYPSGRRPKEIPPLVEQALANPMDFGAEVCEFPAGKIPAGGNMAFRRETLLHYDCFNPSLGRTGQQLTGGEESDLFERMQADGVKFAYVHDAVIWHVIPPSKLTPDYLRRLAFGTGISQRRRAELHNRVGRLYIGECAKWAATLLLACWYTFTLRPERGRRLLMMRLHTTRGIIKKE